MASSDEKPLHTQTFTICGHMVIILANWCVTMGFVEADMWHFTAPGTSGFSLWAAAVFFAATCVTPLMVCVPHMRNIHPPPEVKLIFSIFAPVALLAVSTTALGNSPSTRTVLLGISVAFVPFVILWTFESPIFSSEKRSCRCTGEKSCRNQLFPKVDLDFRPDHRATEFLLAVFIIMCVRWCSGSLNVFYETWQAPCVLLMFVLAYAIPVYVLEAIAPFCRAGNEESPSRKSTGSTVVDTEIEITNSRSEKVVSFEVDTAGPSRSQPDITILSVCSDTSTVVGSKNNDSTLDVSRTQLTGDKTVKSASAGVQFLITCVAVLTGLATGAVLMLFLWVFSSPSLLCRLGGKSPYPMGMVIIALYAVGAIFALFKPGRTIVGILMDKTNYCATSCKITTRERVLGLTSIGIMVILLSAASAMILNGAENGWAFPGSCLISLTMPTALVACFDATRTVVTTQSSQRSCCLSVIPGIIAWFTGLGFTLLHVALILFINPKISLIFFARMDVILGTKIALICAASVAAIFLEPLNSDNKPSPKDGQKIAPSSCSELVQQKCRQHGKVVITVTIILLVLCISLAVGTSLLPSQCIAQHSGSIRAFGKTVASHKSSDHIDVMSWNVQFGHDLRGRDNLPCVSEVIRHMQVDVVGLQESDALPAYWGGKDILGYLEASLVGMRGYQGVHPLKSSLGVGLLTRLEVANHKATILPSDKIRKLPHYSVTETEIRIDPSGSPNSTLFVFNLHGVFKNWTNPPLSEMSRLQLNLVATRVRQLNGSTPVIIMGDFNLNPFEPELEVLNVGLGLNCSVHYNKDPDEYQSTLLNRYAVVDHIFYRGLRLIDSRTLNETGTISDHHPVFARFSKSNFL